MKSILKALLLLALPLLISKSSKEQAYVPFPDSNAVWQEVILPYPPGPIPWYQEHFHYIISGDTLINDVYYKKLFRTDFNVLCSQDSAGPSYEGGIRNDSLEKKVFYIDSNEQEEWLLYDFTLDAGDTVPMTWNNYSYPDLYVESIDSILIGDRFRKSYTYAQETYPLITVIEGIGAETGLLNPMVIFEVISYLRCFHQDDNLLWINPRADSCRLETDTCLVVSIPEKIPDDISVMIFPNPASDWINLHFTSGGVEWHQNLKMEIYNIVGEKVNETAIIPGSGLFLCNVSSLAEGIYLAIIRDDQRIILSGKFIIAR